ncbi:hypothetical protein ACOI22_03355 [Glaciecola sp. 2405UD65-10]|uniref:hypothetical protein n=1 Tax=Glaciecola sp. 2405UD65-10 TaxID=3397244 RepID=UPI003B58E559
MEKALGNILTNNTDLYSAVKGQISPLKRDGYPSVTYEKTGREEDIDISGNGTGIVRTSFTITARATTYTAAKQISEIIKRSVKGPYTQITEPKIYLSVLEDEKEDQLLDPDITEISIDYTFHHTAA